MYSACGTSTGNKAAVSTAGRTATKGDGATTAAHKAGAVAGVGLDANCAVDGDSARPEQQLISRSSSSSNYYSSTDGWEVAHRFDSGINSVQDIAAAAGAAAAPAVRMTGRSSSPQPQDERTTVERG